MAATGKIATAGSVRDRKLISVIIPVLNEENNIARAYAEVCRVFDAMQSYDLEIIFTDNHSVDRTPEILADIARVDPRVKVVRFARNFGFQNSVLAVSGGERRRSLSARLRSRRSAQLVSRLSGALGKRP